MVLLFFGQVVPWCAAKKLCCTTDIVQELCWGRERAKGHLTCEMRESGTYRKEIGRGRKRERERLVRNERELTMDRGTEGSRGWARGHAKLLTTSAFHSTNMYLVPHAESWG